LIARSVARRRVLRGERSAGGDAFGRQALPFGGVEHAVAHETGQRRLVEVLQLAAAALAEMAARRSGVVRARLQRAVGQQQVAGARQRRVAARRGDAIALGGDADDFFGGGHSAAA
jgi:hypothetical protein